MDPTPPPTPTRRFERFEVRDCTAMINKGGFLGIVKGKDIGGPILDMSDFGLRFAAAERLPIGSNVVIRARLVPIAQVVEFPSVVRWSSQDTRFPGRVVTGVEFNGVDEHKLLLVQKLRERMRHEPTQA